jgi:hypothetical protein
MVTFQKLWDAYPREPGAGNPCTSNGHVNFPDQCAIRVGATLAACGVNTSLLPGVRHCWQHEKSKGHALAAEELATGLKIRPAVGMKQPTLVNPAEFTSVLRGKRGVIFFKDYWRRTVDGREESFAGRTGDHIDLWNGYHLAHSFSMVQIYLRIGSLGVGSDHRAARETWFWEVA